MFVMVFVVVFMYIYDSVCGFSLVVVKCIIVIFVVVSLWSCL